MAEKTSKIMHEHLHKYHKSAGINMLPESVFPEEIDAALSSAISKTITGSLSPVERELFFCIGNWCFDIEAQGFFIDVNSAKLAGLPEDTNFVSLPDFCEIFDENHVTKILYNLSNEEAGNIFSDRLTLLTGLYKGQTLIAQGSAVHRNSETQEVTLAAGFICHERCPQAEFLSREIAGDGMFIWNADNDNFISSSSLHYMLGMTQSNMPESFSEFNSKIVHPDDSDAMVVVQHIVMSPQYGNSFECCFRLKHHNGTYIWTISRGLVLERNSKGVANKIIGSISNINLMHNSFDNINSLRFTDSLTELKNRTYFNQNAVRYNAKSHYPVSVIYTDVTGLKLTNDIIGHNYGDYLILKTVQILTRSLHDLLLRKGQHPKVLDTLRHIVDRLNTKIVQMIFNDENRKHILEFTEDEQLLKQQIISFSTVNSAVFADIECDFTGRTNFVKPNVTEIIHYELSPEILRLAGDEILIIFPKCDENLAAELTEEIMKHTAQSNLYDMQHFTPEQRPVPLCFGIGSATTGEEGEDDDFNKTLERADLRMMENKKANHAEHFRILKEFFEGRLHREVSMRDERRSEILSDVERHELRKQRLAEQERLKKETEESRLKAEAEAERMAEEIRKARELALEKVAAETVNYPQSK